jgi:ABC-type sugar transport system substrate-binding protein
MALRFSSRSSASIATIALAGVTLALGATGAIADAKGKKVLLAESFAAHPYVATIIKSFKAKAESYGMEVTVQAAGVDAALQARQFEDGVARKFDLIVVQAVSEQAIVPALAHAKEAGIPVIISNNTPKDGTEAYYQTFVGQDQLEMGRIVGRAIIKGFKDSGRDGGKVALITGVLTEGIGPRRLAGIKEALAANPKIEIAAVEDGKWDTATSERVAGQVFARFAAQGGLDAIYGMADNQAVAAIKAAEAANIAVGTGPKQLLVFGGNCLKEGIEAIKAGKMYSTVSQIPTDIGAKLADEANEYFSGKTLPKQTLLPVNLIDKANVAQWEAACTY